MECVKLSDICDLQNGYAFKSSDYVEFSNTLNCRMSNIRPGAIFDLRYSPKYLPDSFAEKYSDFILNDGDIVIAMTDLAGDPKILGVPAQVKTYGKNVLLNQRVGKLIMKTNDIDFKYLKYNLSNPKNKEYYKKFAGGGLQINISKKDILNMSIPLHDKCEQLKIGNTLEKLDELIKIKRKQIEEFDNFIKSLFLEMISNSMCLNKLGDFISRYNAERALNSYYPILSITKEYGIVFQSVKFKKRIASDDTSSYKVVPKGKLVQGIHIDERNFAIQNLTEFGIVSPAYKIWNVDESKCNSEVLAYALRSDYVMNYIRTKSTGTLKRRESINYDDFMNTPLNLPNIDIQNSFYDKMEQIQVQKYKFELSLNELEKLKSSLMKEYFG